MPQTPESASRRLSRLWLPLTLVLSIIFIATAEAANGVTLLSAALLVWITIIVIGELKHFEEDVL